MSRNITLEQAENIIEACKAEARTVGQPMNVAVVDDGGNLVAFVAMDDTKLIGEVSRVSGTHRAERQRT